MLPSASDSTRTVLLAAVVLSAMSFLLPARTAVCEEVTAGKGSIEIPTYPWDPPSRHPQFQETDDRNIYPYPMLDNLKREKETRAYRTVILENECLRITFIPELGGRIYDVLDKSTSKPMFYVNHVVKPGLIGMCGAWISGGVEFNTGPTGHTVSAVQPVDVEILPPAADGSRSVAVGEVERIYRTRWTVLVTLRPGRSAIEETVRIYNCTETVRPYYFWNCTAMPNPPGFRFIYPMTLGTDHGGSVFYTWPVSEGKDLSLGRSYQDASSIFAYQCDQDFFGSYDEDADRGAVAYANHHILPGKKAWTWGQGSYGTMHQMDLTDDDGPYNEVQTGPLPTQADVGRLDPHEAITWKEWWYPVHGIGGFTFANKDVAVNALPGPKELRLRMIGTGTWDPVEVRVAKDGKVVATASTTISPRKPADLALDTGGAAVPLDVEIRGPREALASFKVPLELPVRTPPERRKPGESASELVQAGWQDYLFARFSKAEANFRKALDGDAKSSAARTGLAYLKLDSDPKSAAEESRAALEVDPDLGPARFALALSEVRLGDEDRALDDAWKASLDPATAVCGRALAAKILLRRGKWEGAAGALMPPGPWQCDPAARNLLALALWKSGDPRRASALARENLRVDPLDAFARAMVFSTGFAPAREALDLGELVRGKEQAVLDLAAQFLELGQEEAALEIIERFYVQAQPAGGGRPIPRYWAAYLSKRLGREDAAERYLREARALSSDAVFPHRIESVPILRWALEVDPKDGKAALYLGHLLFSLGRHGEGRECWMKAADLGESPAVALRALGMAALELDGDRPAAAKYLERAHAADPGDPIVARDLAKIIFSLAEKEDSAERKKELYAKARDTLAAAFPEGKGRSDFVALLARARSRLGEFAETAKLLDSVRITIWEGAREAHDLFEEAHLELGKAHLEAGRAAEALAEFDRALEYPVNLATGKLENTREAHINYLRGNALAALGRKDAALEAWKKAADEPASNDSKKEEARKKAREALDAAGGGR